MLLSFLLHEVSCFYFAIKVITTTRMLYVDVSQQISDIIDLYLGQASCVCFLGEGRGEQEEIEELVLLAECSQQKGLKTCLYSGRDTFIEEWMKD